MTASKSTTASNAPRVRIQLFTAVRMPAWVLFDKEQGSIAPPDDPYARLAEGNMCAPRPAGRPLGIRADVGAHHVAPDARVPDREPLAAALRLQPAGGRSGQRRSAVSVEIYSRWTVSESGPLTSRCR
ncbi:hypothetical protein [Streptomyces sp. RP5T]|uniref:hypothetical protein n=1 Tax=Streptomyces sp. RP5T TaxID=2490848 RepID=UPI000F645D22|nr:hypothetical protein [Streptomyces sp. RP5T]RRR78074.1 hypothetical protein EHS43_26945 [Streptomyces sp. RP5T]